MQEQQNFYPSSDIGKKAEEQPIAFNERQINTDPREQPGAQESPYRSYEDGYQDQSEQERWSQQGEKLRSEPNRQRKVNRITLLLLLICVAFVIGGLSGGLFGVMHIWIGGVIPLMGILLIPIIIIVSVIARRWRVVITPMPTRSFHMEGETTRLVINSNGGPITIRRGEDNIVNINATKRASGITPNTGQIQIDYRQQGNLLDISNKSNTNIIQQISTVEYEITVPSNCDIQLHTGSGRIDLEGTKGMIRADTGSGRIHAHDLQGRITLKTGSGRIEVNDLQGQIDLNTGSSRIIGNNLEGQINLKTGSSRIELDSIRGQLTAETGSGHIDVSRSALSGFTSLKTGSSSISFDGSLDTSGNYNFKTGSGGINVTLPANAAFQLDAKTGSGGVHNEFDQKNVGDGAQARLKLRTGSGGIRVHRMP